MSLIQKYRLALDIAPIPMVLVSDTGEIAISNSSFDTLFEYETGELLGKKIEILIPETFRSNHPHLRKEYHTRPSKRQMGAGRELHGLTRTGTIFPLELGLEPVREAHDSWALVVAVDIRQRKANEQLMNVAMDASASAMVTINAQGNIVFANKTASVLFGYQIDEMIQQPIHMLVPSEIEELHKTYVTNYLKNSTSRPMAQNKQLFGLRKDGTAFPTEIALTPVTSSSGQLIVSTIMDLSERVAAANALEESNAQLKALNMELSHFAYAASHDLKSPLSSVTGLLKICIEDLDNDNLSEMRSILQRVIGISERSGQKVENIMKIARAGEMKQIYSRVDFEKIVPEIWMDLTGGTSQANLIQNHSHSQLPVTEEPTLRIILENLLSNALRYKDPKKSEHIISIDTNGNNGFLKIAVRDNGVGIPKDKQSQVFDMFSKLDSRSNDGLGLALVKKHVNRLGGRILIDSEVGSGTLFTVELKEGNLNDG